MPGPAIERLAAAIAAEQLVTARLVTPIRLAAVAAFWLLTAILGLFLDQPQWHGALMLMSGYLGVSAALLLLARQFAVAGRLAGYAIALFDVPMVFAVQRTALPQSVNPGSTAGFTVAVYCIAIALSALALNRKQLWLTTATACVFAVWLQAEAGLSLQARLSTVALLGVAAMVGWFLHQRLYSLTTRVLEDLARQKEMQSHLEHTDRLASLGMLTASVAHEVGNPLTYLLGNLELLLMKVTAGNIDPTDFAHSLEEAQLGANRVARLLRDLRDMSRKEGQTLREVDLIKVLNGTLDMARAEIRKRAELVLELKPVPKVLGSEVRLSQVFLNLLINAAQAIPERGDRSQHKVVVRTQTGPNGDAVISVSDTGHGIKAEHKQKLFTPFFTTKQRGQGTGLGLSITAEVVRTYGGSIDVESEEGRGATFIVTLPARGLVAPMSAPA